MAASVVSTTVEAAATVIATTTVVTTTIAAAYVAVDGSSISISRPVAVSRTAIAVTIIAGSVEAATVVTVIPGASADEYSAHEVTGPVITIRGARIRIIAIITIRTYRRGTNARDHRTYANADGNLCLSASCNSKKQNPEQSHIF
jgi:hypothetical protein